MTLQKNKNQKILQLNTHMEKVEKRNFFLVSMFQLNFNDESIFFVNKKNDQKVNNCSGE